MPVPTSLTEYVAYWLAVSVARYRPQTVRGYRAVLAHHVLPVLGDVALAALSRKQIRLHLAELLRAGRLAPSTVRMVHTALSACLAQAEADELVVSNVAHGAGRRLWSRAPGEPRALRVVEFEALMRAAQAIAPRLRPLWVLLAHGGLRPGEGLGVNVADVSLSTRRVRVARTYYGSGRFGPPKGGRSRVVPLTRTAALALEGPCDRAGPEGWLFACPSSDLPMNPKSVQKVFQVVRRAAGIRRNVTQHALRHSAATWLIERGAREVDVQRLLGHRSITMTVDLYARGAELPPIVDLLDHR